MLNIGIVFGGISAEHEVSLASAKGVLKAFETFPNYNAKPIGIDKDGDWVFGPDTLEYLIEKADSKMLFIEAERKAADYTHQSNPPYNAIQECDYVLLLTHGTCGEDGKLQGFFEVLGKPVIGCDVLSSAVSFDKHYLKTYLEGQGYLVTPGEIIKINKKTRLTTQTYQDISKRLESQKMVIKPNDNGSGIGISLVKNADEFLEGVSQAAQYTKTVLIEKFIQHREIVVGVIGAGDELFISDLGESNAAIDSVYGYEAKYSENTFCHCPADLPQEMTQKIKNYTAEIYKQVGCRGWARIDFFIENGTNNIYMNEINTIPGLSRPSVFPKVFSSTGMSYEQVIKKIVDVSISDLEEDYIIEDLAA